MKTPAYCAVILCLLHFANGCTSLSSSDARYWVSMVEVIANPEQHNGKAVMLTGFLVVDPVSEEKGGYLYLHREDYENSLTKNAVDVALTDPAGAMKWDKKYVTVEGTFQAVDRKGRFPYAGVLTKVTHIRLIPAVLQRDSR